MDDLVSEIDDCRVPAIPYRSLGDAGHSANLENPEPINEAIGAFLDEIYWHLEKYSRIEVIFITKQVTSVSMVETLAIPDLEYVVAITVILGAFLVLVLRREVGVPVVLSLLFVPPILAGGFGVAIAMHLWLQIPVVHASGLLGGILFGLLVVYEGLSKAGGQKTGRHRF